MLSSHFSPCCHVYYLDAATTDQMSGECTGWRRSSPGRDTALTILATTPPQYLQVQGELNFEEEKKMGGGDRG
jgi:hypothetical protein